MKIEDLQRFLREPTADATPTEPGASDASPTPPPAAVTDAVTDADQLFRAQND